MGLKPGGVCVGIAYLVESALAGQVADYLRERELDHYPVYREAHVDILLDDARAVSATTYLPRKDHPDFLPDLTLHEQLTIIRKARGISGTNPDYVHCAAGSLRDMDIDEPAIFAVEKALDE